jgi:hypothetical protein
MTDILVLWLYATGSVCFLAGSLISLATRLGWL